MKSNRFPATKSPPPASLPIPVAKFLRDLGASTICHPLAESAMISPACLFFEQFLGLFPGEGKKLGRLMARAYGDMALSPAFWFSGSAVPFCLGSKPKGGHYFLHVPRGADSSTPVLLLLHGYGGNLLYFPWAIWKERPDCVLIAPSWQVDWMDGSFEDRSGYVEQALDHAAGKIGVSLQKPWLVPLSQGGPIAFELGAAMPEKFSGLLGISSMTPSSSLAQRFGRNFPVRLLHGEADNRVSCEGASEMAQAIRQAGGSARIAVVPDADHFLLLSHRKQVGEFLRRNV